MIENVLILGNHIQALNLARQAKSLNVGVTLATSSRWCVAYFSNAVNDVLSFCTLDDLLERIRSLYHGQKDTLLFPSSDDMVELLADNYAELSAHFFLGIPAPDVVRQFGNKRLSAQFCSEFGIPTPHTWCPKDLEDVRQISKIVRYPVVLKPAVMYSFHKTFGKKAFRCDSAESLNKMAAVVAKRFSINQMLIQQFIGGGPRCLFSYGTFSVDGEPRAAVIANRIRQNPMQFGNSTTFAVTCNSADIQLLAEKILKATHYTGLAEIEFMYDEPSKQYLFLEINTRAWKWHSISEGLGFGFLSELIRFENGMPTQKHLDFEREMAWTERLTDFAVVAKEIVHGRMNIKEVWSSYRREKVYAVWDKHDMKPFFMYLLLSPMLYFSRH